MTDRPTRPGDDMPPSPSVPHPALRRRPLRLLGSGTVGALAALVLLSGCGAASAPASDGPEPDPAPTVAAAEAEAAEESSPQQETVEGDSSPVAAESEEIESAEEAEPEPAPELEPVEPQPFSGSGSEVVMLEPLGDDVFFATVTHQGSSNIALWSVDENGQDLDLLVNDIGNYQGQVALNFGEDPAARRVEADGDWSIDLVSLGEAPCWDGGTTYEASGDSIVIVDGVADGLTPVTLTHQGESNFAIWA